MSSSLRKNCIGDRCGRLTMVLFSGWIFYIKENKTKTALLPRFIILTASSIALYIHDPREHGGEVCSRVEVRCLSISDSSAPGANTNLRCHIFTRCCFCPHLSIRSRAGEPSIFGNRKSRISGGKHSSLARSAVWDSGKSDEFC